MGDAEDYDWKNDTLRNNHQAFLSEEEQLNVPLMRHLLKRMSRAAFVPDEFQEALQIGWYGIDQKYEAHEDSDPGHQVARSITFLSYLNDVEGGGETLFPVGRTDCGAFLHTHPETGDEVFGAKLCCDTPHLDAEATLRLRPKKGRVVMFFNHKPSGVKDEGSEHIACPVTAGEKWVAQRWLRFQPYQMIVYDEGEGRDVRYDGLPSAGVEDSGAHVRTLSNREPRIYYAPQVLNPAQCAFLIASAEQGVQLGGAGVSFSKEDVAADPTLMEIMSRVELFSKISWDIVTELRIRRIAAGRDELPRVDSEPPLHVVRATVRIFLSDVEEGGSLIFPRVTLDGQHQPGCGAEHLAECCSKPSTLKVPPVQGDAVLLFSHTLIGRLDESAEHGTCRVERGESWIAEIGFGLEPPAVKLRDDDPVGRPILEFVSLMLETLDVHWVNDDGHRIPVAKIDPGPGSVARIHSYVGHSFHVTDESGRLVFETTATSSTVAQHLIGLTAGAEAHSASGHSSVTEL